MASTTIFAKEERVGHAFDLARQFSASARSHPRRVRRRLLTIGMVGVVAFTLAVGAMIVITLRPAAAEAERLLAAFVALGSLGVVAGSVLGFGATLWTAFVYQYLNAMTAKEVAIEATGQVETVVRATTHWAQNADFVQELLAVVLQRLAVVVPSPGISMAAVSAATSLRPHVTDLSRVLSRDSVFRDILHRTFETYLGRDPRVRDIVTHVQETDAELTGV